MPAGLGSQRVYTDACLPASEELEDVVQRLDAPFFQLDSNAAAIVLGRAQFGVEACQMVDERQTDAFVGNLNDNRVAPGVGELHRTTKYIPDGHG